MGRRPSRGRLAADPGDHLRVDVVQLMHGQLELAPVHRRDPQSSRDAAERVRPKVGTQLAAVLAVIEGFGPEGASNRQIQLAAAGHPGHPLWNKVPTRCRTLQRQGLIDLVTEDGEPVYRNHDGQRFMVWKISGASNGEASVRGSAEEAPGWGSR